MLLIMWNLVVLYIGTIITSIPICEAESQPLRDIDIATILNVLNEQQHQNEHEHSPKHEYSLERKSSDDAIDKEYSSHYGSLKSREIVELIDKATHNTDVNDISNDYKEIIKQKNYATHKNHGVKYLNNRINHLKLRDKESVDETTIKEILSYFQSQVKPKEKPRKQALKIQKLLSKLTQGGDKHDRAEVIDDYSKIYIIFNPLAIQKRTRKDSLNNLISKISSLSSASFPKERIEAKKDQQYKGFSVNDGVFSRRARRESKEKYDPRDSMEDYKQKRARNDHGSGRTAIPYIRHRGDIYERSN